MKTNGIFENYKNNSDFFPYNPTEIHAAG